MVYVYTPQGTGGGVRRQDGQSTADTDTVGTIEHCSCGLVGFLAAAALVVAIYPVLVSLTRPLSVLSTTAIVFVLCSLWLASWLTLELAWEWQAGRLTRDS